MKDRGVLRSNSSREYLLEEFALLEVEAFQGRTQQTQSVQPGTVCQAELLQR